MCTAHACPHTVTAVVIPPTVAQVFEVCVQGGKGWALCSCLQHVRVWLIRMSLHANLCLSRHGCWCVLQGADGSWQWRTNLAASNPYWRGWYEGLSDAFLALPVPKMLLLAGTDRCAGLQSVTGCRLLKQCSVEVPQASCGVQASCVVVQRKGFCRMV